MKTTGSFLFVLAGMLCLINGPAWGQDFKMDFQEADSQFIYQGKPIHPGLVLEFSSWISDSELPTTISVDVAAPHSNEYSADIKKNGKNICMETEDALGKKDGGFFCYERLGKLNNGLHVLKVSDGGSAGGTFSDLYFVRFDKGEGYTQEGQKRERLLMSIVRTFILGDRDDGEIKVLKDSVVVGKSRYRNRPIELTF